MCPLQLSEEEEEAWRDVRTGNKAKNEHDGTTDAPKMEIMPRGFSGETLDETIEKH